MNTTNRKVLFTESTPTLVIMMEDYINVQKDSTLAIFEVSTQHDHNGKCYIGYIGQV